MRGAVVNTLQFSLDAMLVLVEADKPPTIMNRGCRKGLCMPPQHLLDKLLRHTMRQFGGAP